MRYDLSRSHRFCGGVTRARLSFGLVSLMIRVTALVLVGVVPTNAQQAPTAALLVFDGVTVVDVEQGKLVPDQRVVIAGNHIQAVGNSRVMKVPKGAQVVEAQGKYLIPGLWDLHVHPDTLMSFYPLFIAHGVTGIRDAYAFISVETQVRWWHEILAGTRVGPPRQLLAGQNPATGYDDMVARKAAGVNFLKLYPFTPEAAADARRAGLPFGGHVYGEASALEASDSGMSIIDHVNSSGGLDALCTGDSGDFEQCRQAAETFKRNGTWWAPTLVIHASFHSYDEQLSASMPIFNRLAGLVQAFWKKGSPLLRHGNWLRDSIHAGTLRAQHHDSTADSLGFLRIAQRVGLPILAATDMGSPNVMKMLPGFSLHTELAMLVAEGLTTLNALQSATLNPAKMLHATDSLGTVAPGKLADLVLLDANPLADITNTTTIRAVVANGRYFDRAALDKLLTEAQANPSDLVRWTRDTLGTSP